MPGSVSASEAKYEFIIDNQGICDANQNAVTGISMGF